MERERCDSQKLQSVGEENQIMTLDTSAVIDRSLALVGIRMEKPNATRVNPESVQNSMKRKFSIVDEKSLTF